MHKEIGEARNLVDKQGKLLEELKKKMEGDIEKLSKEANTLVKKIKEEGETEQEQEKGKKKRSKAKEE